MLLQYKKHKFVPSECLLFRTLILIRGVKSRRTGKVRKWPYDYQGESFTVRELSKVGQYMTVMGLEFQKVWQ